MLNLNLKWHQRSFKDDFAILGDLSKGFSCNIVSNIFKIISFLPGSSIWGELIEMLLPRVDPAYMYYYIHWTRLLCTGIIPFSYLSYINLRIYTRMRQTSLSTVRSRSSTTKKASNLAAVLIVIGEKPLSLTTWGAKADINIFFFESYFNLMNNFYWLSVLEQIISWLLAILHYSEARGN